MGGTMQNRDDLIQFIRMHRNHGTQQNPQDIAVKIYIYDILPLLLSQEEIGHALKSDQLTLRKKRKLFLIKTLKERFNAIALQALEDEDCLTIILYGLLTSSQQLLTMIVDLNCQGVQSMGQVKKYKCVS